MEDSRYWATLHIRSPRKGFGPLTHADDVVRVLDVGGSGLLGQHISQEAPRGTRGSSIAPRRHHPSALFRVRVEPVVFEDERRDLDSPETRGGPGGSPFSRPKSYADVRQDRRGSRLRALGSTHLGALPRE